MPSVRARDPNSSEGYRPLADVTTRHCLLTVDWSPGVNTGVSMSNRRRSRDFFARLWAKAKRRADGPILVIFSRHNVFIGWYMYTLSKRVPGACIRGGKCNAGSSRLHRLRVSLAQKAEMSGNEHPRLRAYSVCSQLTFLHVYMGLSIHEHLTLRMKFEFIRCLSFLMNISFSGFSRFLFRYYFSYTTRQPPSTLINKTLHGTSEPNGAVCTRSPSGLWTKYATDTMSTSPVLTVGHAANIKDIFVESARPLSLEKCQASLVAQ